MPEGLALAVSFLCGSRVGYIAGSRLPVDLRLSLAASW